MKNKTERPHFLLSSLPMLSKDRNTKKDERKGFGAFENDPLVLKIFFFFLALVFNAQLIPENRNL